MSVAEQQFDPLLEPTFIESEDGVQLAGFSAGNPEQPTIVFVHGYPDTHSIWRRMIHALQGSYHCVLYDVRGAGASSRPEATRDYKLDQLAADLNTVIDWASPDKPVHVVAHDWGSIQAWEAVTDPAMAKRIASFTSISGPCLDHVGHLLRLQWRNPAAFVGQMGKSWYIGAMHIPGTTTRALHRKLAPVWPKLSRKLEGEALPHNPTKAQDSADGIKLYRANMGPRLTQPRERHTSVPVQVIRPQHDPFVGAIFTRDLEHWVDHLTITTIEGGHWAPYSRARLVANHCRGFIQRTELVASALAQAEEATS